jgi:hypothetical protein
LPQNLHFSPEALGWLRGAQLSTIGLLGILIGLGHSVVAMSGEETLAQVYREIEHPKLVNLKKAALIIFIYNLVFTSLVSFFAAMIIPPCPTRAVPYLNNAALMHVSKLLRCRREIPSLRNREDELRCSATRRLRLRVASGSSSSLAPLITFSMTCLLDSATATPLPRLFISSRAPVVDFLQHLQSAWSPL